MSIRDYITDHNISCHYDKILKILNTIRDEFNKNPHLGFTIDLLIFGGFVRDIVQKIPYEELLKKDVDVYVSFRFIDDRWYLNSYGFIDMIRKIRKILGIVYSTDISNELTYNRLPKEDPYSFANYSVLKFIIDGIHFDLACDLSGVNRFESVLDFRCNALYFCIDTGKVEARSNFCTLEECIQDIKDRRLVSFVGKERNHIKQDLDYRLKKMNDNGYYN